MVKPGPLHVLKFCTTSPALEAGSPPQRVLFLCLVPKPRQFGEKAGLGLGVDSVAGQPPGHHPHTGMDKHVIVLWSHDHKACICVLFCHRCCGKSDVLNISSAWAPQPPFGKEAFTLLYYIDSMGFPCGSAGKEPACNTGDLGSIPGLERSPGEGKGYPLQYSGLENSIHCIVHGVA